MQLSYPRTCPDCNDGKKPDGKRCIICQGSGLVYLVPASRPIDERTKLIFEQMMNRYESNVYS